MLIPHWVQQAIETYGYWGVLIAVALESTGVPFPGETALLAASIYAGTTGRISPVLVIVAAATGAILGDNLGFAIGHFGGYPLLQRIVRLLHLDERALQYAQDYFAKHGNKTVFLGRFFALLRTYVALLAGINRMPWRIFLVWNALGGITWATIFGLLGFILGNNLPLLGSVLKFLGIAGFVLLGIFVAGIIFFIARSRRGRENALAATTSTGPERDKIKDNERRTYISPTQLRTPSQPSPAQVSQPHPEPGQLQKRRGKMRSLRHRGH